MASFAITLDNEPRCAFVDFHGHSGTAYRFSWQSEIGAMTYLGRAITGEEFDAAAQDIFRAGPDQNFCRAVPRRIPATEPEARTYGKRMGRKEKKKPAHAAQTEGGE